MLPAGPGYQQISLTQMGKPCLHMRDEDVAAGSATCYGGTNAPYSMTRKKIQLLQAEDWDTC